MLEKTDDMSEEAHAIAGDIFVRLPRRMHGSNDMALAQAIGAAVDRAIGLREINKEIADTRESFINIGVFLGVFGLIMLFVWVFK